MNTVSIWLAQSVSTMGQLIRNLINISGKIWDDDKNLADAEIWGLMTLVDGENGKHLTIANTASDWSDELVYQAKVLWPNSPTLFGLAIDKGITDFQIRLAGIATGWRVELYYGNGTDTGSHQYSIKATEDRRVHLLEVGLKKSTGRVWFKLDDVTYYDGTQEIVSAGQTTHQVRIGSYYTSNYGTNFYISDVKVWKSLGKEDANLLFFIPDVSNGIDVKNQITVTSTDNMVYSWYRNGSIYNIVKGYSLYTKNANPNIYIGYDYDTETAISFSKSGYSKIRDYAKGTSTTINMFGFISLNPGLLYKNQFDIWNRANTDYWSGLTIYESNNYLWPLAELTPAFWTSNILKDRDKIDIDYVTNVSIANLKQYGSLTPNPLATPDTPSDYYTLDGTTTEYSTGNTGVAIGQFYQTTTGPNYAPQAYYFNGKTYCIWKKRTGYSMEVMLFTVTHSTGEISASSSVVVPKVGATDIHIQPAVIVGDDGYIYVAEPIPDAVGDINAKMAIYKSNSAEDITSGFTQIYITSDAFYTYPHLLKNSNGIYLIFQGAGYIYIVKGSTTGTGWTMYTMVSLLSTVNFPYNLTAVQADGDIHLTINFLYGLDNQDSYPNIYHLKSTNDANCGLLWKSLTSSFSQNISTYNKITISELDEFAVVINGLHDDITKINYAYCGYVYSGNPYLVVLDGGCTNSQATSWTTSYKLVYFEPENYRWVSKTIEGVFTNIPSNTGFLENSVEDHPWAIIVYNQAQIDIIVTILNSGIKELRRYRTTDRGDTWSFIENIYTAKTSVFNQIPRNAIAGVDDIIIYGTIPNGTTDSNILIQKLTR
jgi:hypothetical protein